MPSLKLNNAGNKSKHCGDFEAVAAEALMERKGHDPDINPELTPLNVYEGFKTAEELMRYSDKHCKGMYDSTGRGVRKDAVRMCVTVIKPPAAMMNKLSPEAQKRFLDNAYEKLEEIVGRRNIKAKAYHFDEQGAHLHVFWEPITADGRLCAKEMHNLKFFSRLNKEMPEHLRNHGWDIDDCQAYDQAAEALKSEKQKSEERRKNGRHSSVYKAEAERDKNILDQRIDEMKDWLSQIPDWPEYEAAADHAIDLIESFRKLQEDVFRSRWIFRNRKAEKSLLRATEGLSAAIRETINALRSYEANEGVPDDEQRSRVIVTSLEQMMEMAATRERRTRKAREEDRELGGRS